MSKRHVDATKAALKRYTDIVAKGGWKPFPSRRCNLETVGHLS